MQKMRVQQFSRLGNCKYRRFHSPFCFFIKTYSNISANSSSELEYCQERENLKRWRNSNYKQYNGTVAYLFSLQDSAGVGTQLQLGAHCCLHLKSKKIWYYLFTIYWLDISLQPPFIHNVNLKLASSFLNLNMLGFYIIYEGCLGSDLTTV
jgi:hypothetical protein